MKKLVLLIVIFIGVSAMYFAAGAEEKKGSATPEAAFVAEKCGACHGIDRVCGKIGQKNAEQWAVTVKRMGSKGKGINEGDQKQILDYLSSAKDSSELCPK